jgi:hypothetical protein
MTPKILTPEEIDYWRTAQPMDAVHLLADSHEALRAERDALKTEIKRAWAELDDEPTCGEELAVGVRVLRHGLTQERGEWKARAEKAEDFIRSEGYRRCDVMVCNCGSWHGGHLSDRMREIREVLDDAGLIGNDYGNRNSGGVALLVDQRDAAQARVRELESQMASGPWRTAAGALDRMRHYRAENERLRAACAAAVGEAQPHKAFPYLNTLPARMVDKLRAALCVPDVHVAVGPEAIDAALSPAPEQEWQEKARARGLADIEACESMKLADVLAKIRAAQSEDDLATVASLAQGLGQGDRAEAKAAYVARGNELRLAAQAAEPAHDERGVVTDHDYGPAPMSEDEVADLE